MWLNNLDPVLIYVVRLSFNISACLVAVLFGRRMIDRLVISTLFPYPTQDEQAKKRRTNQSLQHVRRDTP